MDNNIIFRKAVAEDIEELTRLRQMQLREEDATADADISKNIAEYFNSAISDNSFISWIALIDNNIIATSGIVFYRLPPYYTNVTGKIAQVTNMYTLKEYRRKGLAAALLTNVIEEAKKKDINIIRVSSSVAGQALYEKSGFIKKENMFELTLN